ncbi:hypothetical protein P691DRAFT_768399, partial [Macrolepiota fuliginosa MF-IS2]
MVKAMGMLGNLSRGLASYQKHLLYQSCVLPIATYGYRLWYFEGAWVKGLLNQFACMQRHTAVWITGAFHTSPTGGTEALVGLIPFHLHIQKLAKQSMFWVKMLSVNHALNALLGSGNSQGVTPHPRSLALLPDAQRTKVKGSLVEADSHLSELSETFNTCAPEACPGNRLLDIFKNRVQFFDAPPSKEEEAYSNHMDDLDLALDQATHDPSVAVCVMDTSLPLHGNFQAVLAAQIHVGGALVYAMCRPVGLVLAPDAEQAAIRLALCKATTLPRCKSILVFTDSLALARRAVDPSIQSGQFLSLAVVQSLCPWLEASADWVVQVYQVPSKEEWHCHKEAHNFASDLKVLVGMHALTSLNYLCAQGTKKCLDRWTTLFGVPSFHGNQFLELTNRLDKLMKPRYTGGGAWLS